MIDDNNSIIDNEYNQITIGDKTYKKYIICDNIELIGDKTYKKHIICDNIELIEKFKDDKILNPNLDNNEYIIKCENENKYIIDPIIINSGGNNFIYNLIGQDNKVIRISKHADEKDEIQGFFIQYYISKKCPYIRKIYEFGYLIMDNKKYAYSILEKLIEPNLNVFFSKNFKKFDGLNCAVSKIIMEQIFDGFNCIVSNKYTHIDFSMRNIGIGEDKNVRIFDFGSSYYNNTNDDINDINYKESMIGFKIELANLYNIFGEKNKAVSLYEECFENVMKSLGNEDPNILRDMNILRDINNIAHFYNRFVEKNKAISLYEEYFEKIKKLRGNDNPYTLRVMQAIAIFYNHAHNVDKAIPIFEECLDKMKRVHGNDHPHTLSMMIIIANVYYKMCPIVFYQYNNKAILIFEECFEKIMKSLNNDNPNTLHLMKEIADFYNERDRGIRMFEEYFEKSKQLRGNDNPYTLQVMRSIADFHFKSFIQKSDFDDLPNPNEFEQIYIGIGAKHYKSNHPIKVNTGPFQLYPNFVDCEKSALIIIIDPQLDIETQHHVERSIFERTILRSHNFSLINTTYVMINTKFNKKMSEKMISYLEQRPSVDKLWICSFVTFASSSATFIERDIENKIDTFFENEEMPYKNNSYKWLGHGHCFLQPYISICQYRGVSLIKKPRDQAKHLIFCYEEILESTKILLDR